MRKPAVIFLSDLEMRAVLLELGIHVAPEVTAQWLPEQRAMVEHAACRKYIETRRKSARKEQKRGSK